MKTIPLKEAHRILEESAAIIVEDVVIYPSVWELTGDDSNEFLYLSWTDGDFNEFSLKFLEGDNREVKVSGCSLFLTDADIDNDKDELQITILQAKEIE